MRKFFARHPILFPSLYGTIMGAIASLFFPPTLKWWPMLGGLFTGFVLGLLFEQAMKYQVTKEQHFSHFVETIKPELRPLPDPLTSLFLYNTLHNISALMMFDQEAAAATAEKLANLVRSVNELRRTKTTSLGEEFKAAGLYLDIEKARLVDRLVVKKQFDQEFFEVPFPSLALYPLVDNGIRYGAEMHVEPVTVTMTCQQDENHLLITIMDECEAAAPDQEKTIDENREAVFAAAKHRLVSFYGSGIKMKRTRLQPDGEKITIRIPLNNAKIGRYSS